MKNNWIKLTLIALVIPILIGLFFLVGHSVAMDRVLQDNGLNSGWTTFKSKTGGFTMDAPKEWLAVDNLQDDHDAEIIAGLIHRFPDVRIAKLKEISQVEDAAEWATTRGMSFPEYSIVSNEPYISEQGYQGQLIEYVRDGSNLSGKYQMHCVDWCLTNNDQGYVFLFCTEVRQWPENDPGNKVEDAFMRMINSIEFYQ